ncbi:multiple inositol polyphosphate phosphatase 1-like [Watersipora subatra]|uniref:multiple inositol polyphosphate phosphatase 1-like n=1 Tax=Watersipora subatra TaxID=2589382 RepID=UPI00355C1A7D
MRLMRSGIMSPAIKVVSLLVLIMGLEATSDEQLFSHSMLYSSKTRYEQSRMLFQKFSSYVRLPGHEIIRNIDSIKSHPAGCEPDQLSLILRHGSRYPSRSWMKQFPKMIDRLANLDMKAEFSGLKTWLNPFDGEPSRLSRSGMDENAGIARRYFNRFSKVFKTALLSQNLEVIVSSRQRTGDSAKAFLTSLSQLLHLDQDNFASMLAARDDLTCFYKNCPAHSNQVELEKRTNFSEYNLFLEGSEIRQVVQRVSKRLSLTGNADLLTLDDISAMWMACRMETALCADNCTSPWCKIFTTDDSAVLEYASDLQGYWQESYGYPINYEQSCPLLADIVNNSLAMDQDSSSASLSLYFGHSETLNPLLAILGLFKDESPLLASNYELHRENRKFRQSFMGSFASNLGFVRYKCEKGNQSSNSDWPSQLDTSMIQLIFNEHIIPFPFTKKAAISFDEFLRDYHRYIYHCNFDQLCGLSKIGHEEL